VQDGICNSVHVRFTPKAEPARVLPSAHQLWQLGDIRRNPSRLVGGKDDLDQRRKAS